MWYVYILKSNKCQAEWYYIGSTNNVERRLGEHNCGKVFSTKAHRPLTLVYIDQYGTEAEARGREKMLKGKRKAKEILIRNIRDSRNNWGIV